ncbi:unnamed protein product [Hyaloperonospora brassicae]|uniref:Clu domain-containing protein n=1 Tax=Hyaloperonospora brassicae TaxID=162125 RepID=A0AAV0TKQ9_HYABA|nr:unnamed protein product [Hyaloperonospora brassicae]
MLPARVRDRAPRSRTSSSGSYAGSLSSGSESPRQRRDAAFSATQQLASELLGIQNETMATTTTSTTSTTASTSTLSQELMNVLLRLGDLTQHEGDKEEPQLSVRLREGQVELLAAPTDEEHVDFLGPAENIKKLFKLPYSQSRVSLAVHRVGTTLVVDGELEDTDVPVGLFEDGPQDTLRWVQHSDDSTQRLLYEKFIYESTVNASLPVSETTEAVHTMATDEQKPRQSTQHRAAKQQATKLKKTKKNKRKTAALHAVGHKSRISRASQELRLVSAVQEKEGRKSDECVPSAGHESSNETCNEVHTDGHLQHGTTSTAPSSQQESRPSFIWTGSNSHASAEQYSPLHTDSQMFQRILKWKFNDLKMILGSQVLLFSNPEHPAVSLKLHDMDKELSLCTVLDYYLDNVIANIPELAVCMHSKGLVRGYKLVETRQIPYMSSTGRPLFNVHDVSMNASMLLKFLQENCSRPNGTYWLHRKEGESSLRLYDVDVLSQGSQLKWKYMMAMLCYRFAARASRLSSSLAAGTPQLQQQLQQRERDLLCTCMRLLGEIAQKGGAAHGPICSSVSEQLADTYLRECNQTHAFSSTESTSVGSDREAAVRLLEKAKQYLLASIKLFEECSPKDGGPALTHTDDEVDAAAAVEGNGELTPEDADENDEMGNFMDEELNRLQLKFSSACLELGRLYARDHKWTDVGKCMVEAGQFLTLSSIPDDVQPLDLSSREQDAVFDLMLDNLDFDGVGRAGLSQGKIRMCESGTELRCFLLGLIGDMAAQKPVGVYDGLAALYNVVSGIKRDQLPSLRDHANEFIEGFEQNAGPTDDETLASREKDLLMLSFLAYFRALSPPANSELYFMMMKKLGNASNELGKYSLAVRCDYKEAFRWFERGCKIFSDIEDGVNVALLRANLAHLHKIFAQGKSADDRVEHYEAAIRLCTEALQLLKQSKADMDLNRKVKGELALTYLVWAVDLANSVSILGPTGSAASTKVRENKALTIFNKALSLYAELGDEKQTASTHYQIASFHSRMISSTLQTERENIRADKCDGFSPTLASRMEITRRHYEKALNYFGAAEVGKTFVLIHQELADLHILGGRFEGIEHALLILLSTYKAFHVGHSKNRKLEDDDMALLACNVVAKVKAVLHQLIRLCSSDRLTLVGANGTTSKSKKLDMFKKMYKEMIYYDDASADSVVPILGTLRGMCIL